MRPLDWVVLCITLLGILAYGVYKSYGQRNMEAYFLDNRSMPWYIILLSIMGTQASAITFLSAPGQAYSDGMRFVQYYFGLPLAMVVLCITFVPIFHRLKVYTAYEFLEQRFDLKTRSLTAILFLIQRGLSTGISIYAPAIILSSLLGWNIYWTNIFMGGLLIIYTVAGGARAVAHTQKLQLAIIFVGMFLAGWIVVHLMPRGVSFKDALHVAGKLGKMNIIETKINITSKSFWQDKYNIWSGLIGGFFLALSYFGTDQSQVGRYLTAKSIRESRLGLLMNGFVKVPMQFAILLIGALIFSFYQFYHSPVFFNAAAVKEVENSSYKPQLTQLTARYDSIGKIKKTAVQQLVTAFHQQNQTDIDADSYRLRQLQDSSQSVRQRVKQMIHHVDPLADTDDTNYIFLHFVLDYLPEGLVGLLIAIIFLAAWGSTAAALNSLASASVIDVYKRAMVKSASDRHYFLASKWFTLFWGLFSIVIAQFANKLGSLIQAVNILGSLFYGSILGVFLVAFYFKKIRGTATFWSALLAECFVIFIYWLNIISFLWLNVIGCVLVIFFAWVLQQFLPVAKQPELA
jgi:SSS family transporter